MRILTIAAACGLALGLAACGQRDHAGNATEADTNNAAAQAAASDAMNVTAPPNNSNSTPTDAAPTSPSAAAGGDTAKAAQNPGH
jgi:hypothetical protein